MTLIQTWDDILQSIGAVAGQSYKKSWYYLQLNEPIIDLTCSLWQKYPRQIPIFPYSRGFANSICGQIGKPLPLKPPPNFLGGQCTYQYNVKTTYNVYFNGNDRGIVTSANMAVYGPLESIGIRISPNFPFYFLESYVVGRDQFNNSFTATAPIGGVGFTAVLLSSAITPPPGQIDNCGNLPSQYPPDPQRDPNDFTRRVPVNIYDKDVNLIDTIDIDIDIPIDADINIPITIDIGGKRHKLDDDGLNDTTTTDDNDNLDRRVIPPPSDETYDTDEVEDTSGDDKVFDDILVWVEIDVTQKPHNAKSQWGDGGPDVYYCGWFEFKVGDASMHRTPIHFLKAVYLAPEYANGYAFTLYNGFKGKAKAYLKKPETPI